MKKICRHFSIFQTRHKIGHKFRASTRTQPTAAMHSNVYARGCNWLLRSSHRGSIPTAACYRDVGYWIRCETYVCFIHAQKERADGTPMIMGYRCCSTVAIVYGYAKNPAILAQRKNPVFDETSGAEGRGERGDTDEFVFVSRLSPSVLFNLPLFLPLESPFNRGRCI